ncbi:MAG: hypothetical protein L3J43_10720 [Sulfurovum sp.]|nr:hypothetical protein [Sulfurovum sp.]
MGIIPHIIQTIQSCKILLCVWGGVHLSLGRKHGMYAKPVFKRGDGKFHIDVFIDTKRVYVYYTCVLEDESWILSI